MSGYRYFLFLSYNGTAYHGWQIQPNGVSVQEVLEKALATLLRAETPVTGAGRTDAGVHARLMVAHFDTIIEIHADDMTKKLNSILPFDIAIHKILKVKNDAHARFDALSRTYEYHVVTEKNVFRRDFAARIQEPLDWDAMNRAAALLPSFTDFTSFSKLHTDVKTNLCKITFAKWERSGDVWIFTITADRFLRNMVRAVVGTLFDVGRGKISLEDFKTIVEAKDRCKAGVSVPAQGLYLTAISYPDEIFTL